MDLKSGAVRKRARGFISESWQSQANLSFFLVLLVLVAFILPSMGFGKNDLRLYVNINFSVLIVSGVAIAWGRRSLFFAASLIAIVTLVVRWLSTRTPTPRLELWSNWWSMTSVAVIALVLLVQVFRAGPVTHLRIQGAIAVYLLFGIGWAHAYHIAALANPDSFTNLGAQFSSVEDWIYYSFVTLTTVGYGDITPVHQVARTLSITEALAGQLYLAVMIARLVAMEVINWQQKATPTSNR
jgi:hypothetical protein